MTLDDLALHGENRYGYLPLMEAIGARFGVDAQDQLARRGVDPALDRQSEAFGGRKDARGFCAVVIKDPAGHQVASGVT